MNKKTPLPTESLNEKRIFTYVSIVHYERLLADQRASTYPSLSQYIRNILSGYHRKITYRDLNEEQVLFMMNNLSIQLSHLSQKIEDKVIANGQVDQSLLPLIYELRNLFNENKAIVKKLLTIWSQKYTLVKTSPKH